MRRLLVLSVLGVLAGCAQEPVPFPDLVETRQAEKAYINERLAKGEITPTEADALQKASTSRAISEDHRRRSSEDRGFVCVPVGGMTICR
jgi:hypothetical protein